MIFIRHVNDPAPMGAGLCGRGTKQWCEAHGVDFRDFLKNGVPVERIEAINDALGNRVCAAARADAERNSRG